MSATGAPAASPLEAAVTARALGPSGDARLDAATGRLAAAAGESLVGLVFFGSRCTGAARADAWSAYDVFVLVRSYRSFYEAVRRAGLSGKPPRLMALVSTWLPPTQFSLRFDPEGVHVKASVLRYDTYRRETSPRRRDHFVIGRLFQPARVLRPRDDAARAGLVEGLVEAHRETWSWARPWLPAAFDASAYGRSALATSMRWEVRPEPEGRAEALWGAQEAEQVPVFVALLGELERGGAVARAPGGTWRAARPVGVLERLRTELYFRRSILRATARWLKHVVTFEGWLDYIVRKASRHTGEPITLTERERRWPWIFLWGRLFRYLRDKDRGGRTP